MSANKYRDHVVVLIEDDANRQILIGFLNELNAESRLVTLLPNSGGWANVRADFQRNELAAMRNFPRRYIVMLVDFDEQDNHCTVMLEAVPDDLKDRVFVIGAMNEPEDLRRANLGSFEEIGCSLARDCRDNSLTSWRHDLLKHNAPELARMVPVLKPILFPQV